MLRTAFGHHRALLAQSKQALSSNNSNISKRLMLMLSTTAAATTAPPRVVSRRAYEKYRTLHPPKPSPPKPKPEEKPWPLYLQIAGYCMAAVGIPYSIAWFASSNRMTREVLSMVIPNINDILRHHFGEIEPNSVAYCDRNDTEPHYQLQEEPTFQQRKQQSFIESLIKDNILVRVQIRSATGGNHVEQEVESTVPGSTLATPAAILKAVGLSTSSSIDNVKVSVDFSSSALSERNESNNNITTDDNSSLLQQETTMSEPSTATTAATTSDLLKRTSTYSSWQYVPNHQQQQQAVSNNTDNLEISKLKYEIEALQRDLQDINNTRDRDDMENELREKRSALRKKQWKKRLGGWL